MNINKTEAVLWTIREAASAARLTERGLENRIARGSGPKLTYLSPRCRRIRPEDLRAWVASMVTPERGLSHE